MKTRKKVNKREQVLKHLQTHKKGITSYDAFKKYGDTRLSGDIFQLKQRGYNIITIMETGKDRNGNISRYARYILMDSTDKKSKNRKGA